jgi:predicted nucleotidyltransferase
MAPEITPLLRDLRAGLDALYGERLARLVLFGSHARGDAREDSDVDVLVVLRGEVGFYREVERTGPLTVDLLDRYRVPVSLIPVSEEDFLARRIPLFVNAHAEGVPV